MQLQSAEIARADLAILLIGLVTGYLGAFFFPCDFGCPIEGSTRQTIHNIAGMVLYVAAILGIFLYAIGLGGRLPTFDRLLAIAVAAMTPFSVSMMGTAEQANMRGVWQRFADYSVFCFVVLQGFRLAR